MNTHRQWVLVATVRNEALGAVAEISQSGSETKRTSVRFVSEKIGPGGRPGPWIRLPVFPSEDGKTWETVEESAFRENIAEWFDAIRVELDRLNVKV